MRKKTVKMFCSIENSNSLEKNMGFTLVELVMVLVLLGILAAVALPKYFDMQEAAQQRAALLAVAEAQARIESRFAELVVGGESCAKAVEEVKVLANLADSKKDGWAVFGDYGLSGEDIASTGTEVQVAVVNGDATTLVTFSSSQPKLYVPSCGEEKVRISADKSAEALWKVVQSDAELKQYFEVTKNKDLKSFDRDDPLVERLESLVSDLGFDIEEKVWTVGLDGNNLRVYVADVSITAAKDADFKSASENSKLYVKGGYYDSATQEMSYGYVRIRYDDDGNPNFPTGTKFKKSEPSDDQKYEIWKNQH